MRHRSSKAFTINLDTCPKNAEDTAACTGLAKEKARSSVTKVGPLSSSVSCDAPTVDECCKIGGLLLICGEVGDAD